MAAILAHGRPQDLLLIFVSESMIMRGNLGQGLFLSLIWPSVGSCICKKIVN